MYIYMNSYVCIYTNNIVHIYAGTWTEQSPSRRNTVCLIKVHVIYIYIGYIYIYIYIYMGYLDRVVDICMCPIYVMCPICVPYMPYVPYVGYLDRIVHITEEHRERTQHVGGVIVHETHLYS
jgi:hypothetical protein